MHMRDEHHLALDSWVYCCFLGPTRDGPDATVTDGCLWWIIGECDGYDCLLPALP